jgi:SAM-dependent methyltransferase
MHFSNESLYKKARKNRDLNFDRRNKEYYQNIEDYDWVKVINEFSGLESFYHKIREIISLNYIKPFIFRKRIKIVDAGCGTGLILRHLPKNAIGVDMNPRHLKRAKKYAPHCKFLLADIEKIPVRSSSVDLILCFETIEHILFPERILRELRRLLVKNGVLIGSVPNRSLLWRLRRFSSTHPHDELFHREFSKHELISLLGRDFIIEEMQNKILGMNFFFRCRKK